jgi:hypothetical protein
MVITHAIALPLPAASQVTDDATDHPEHRPGHPVVHFLEGQLIPAGDLGEQHGHVGISPAATGRAAPRQSLTIAHAHVFYS